MRSGVLVAFLGLALLQGVCSRPAPAQWNVDVAATERVNPQELHTIFLAMALPDKQRLFDAALAVSTLSHPQYGQHLSPEELRDVLAVPQRNIDAATQYLLDHGAVEVEVLRTGDVIRARMPLGGINDAFGVTMKVYRHDDGRDLRRTEEDYTLPAHLATAVDLVMSVSEFPMAPRRSPNARMTPVAPSGPETSKPRSASGLVMMSRGGSNVVAQFTPVCSDGKAPAAPAPADCSASGEALTAVNWVSKPAVPTMHDNRPPATTLPSCAYVGNVSMCSATLTGVEYYSLRNYTIQLAFGKYLGPATTYGFSVVSTPPLTPQTIADHYNVPLSGFQANGSQAVVEFEQQYYSPSDLTQFQLMMGLPTDTPVNVVGPNNASMPGGEANLDIQYLMGLSPGVNTTFWSIYASTSVEIDDILKWAMAMANTTMPPLVNSISYGMTETHVDKYQGKGYLARSDVEFAKLAARGLTVVIADGDTGASDLGAAPMSVPTCYDESDPTKLRLHADWPSQSMWVTAVSSTYFTPQAQPVCYTDIDCSEQPLGEVVVGMTQGLFWGSGGGVSEYSKMPAYQASAVRKYLAQNATTGAVPPQSLWNPTGRAYPDATANGHNFMVVIAGVLTAVDGTSASAPAFSGVIAALNSALMTAGRAPLGFLNPMMYDLAEHVPGVFNDVLVGNNRCGAIGFEPACCPYGFSAAPGWDGASGLGSPNYQRLLDALMAR